MRRQLTKQLKQSWGFSLVEMAVVITIMGILMTFGIKLATSYQNKGAFSATSERQKQIRDTLSAYLGRNGKLPCPADPGVFGDPTLAGVEDRGDTHCNKPRGILPFKTLGIPRNLAIDGWDRYFTYSVWDDRNPAAACSADFPDFEEVPLHNWTIKQPFPPVPNDYTETYHDGGNGCIKINDDGIGRRAVAVIISHGPNGFGGFNSKGVQVSGASGQEAQNIIDPDIQSQEIFQSLPVSLDGFDDLVMDISADDLLIPLKKSGTIVSIRELERQYLYTLFDVAFDSGAMTCKLTVSPPASPVVTSEDLNAPRTIRYNTATITISYNDYCKGFSPPTESGSP